MKPSTRLAELFAVFALTILVPGNFGANAADSPQSTTPRKTVPAKVIPLVLNSPISLSIHSPDLEWKGGSYHLVNLGSIEFKLDDSGQLKAEVQAGVTMFDNVDYDISAAVFDETGQLLGTARAQCKVERLWLGHVLMTSRTIDLDFGVSLDYAKANGFMLSISKRKVLTPDEWQAKK